MNSFLAAFDVTLATLRVLFVGGAVVAGTLCVVEWSVRTKRLHPFSSVARAARRLMGPVIAPVERTIVRAGGLPSTAPWWTLAGVIVAGIVVLSLLQFVRDEFAGVYWAFNTGPRGVIRLLLSWVFGVFYIALIVRVVSSWVRMNPFGRFVRWSFSITEPALAPLRKVFTFRMIDFSPLVAWVLVSWFIQPFVMRLV